jgi:capsular exopolysaccharide synthesis family protein
VDAHTFTKESDEKAACPVTLTQYLRVLRHQWFVVVLLAILGLGAAAAYTYRQTPMYSAQIQLFVSTRAQETDDISQISQGSTFTQQRVKSYADLVTSPLITQAVVQQLRLPYTPAQVGGEISASSPLDTVLLDISVSDSDPNRAAAIANAIGVQFPQLISSLETQTQTSQTSSGETLSPVTVKVTRDAVPPGAPDSPRIPLNIALGLLVGLGLGIAAAVLRDQLNTTVSGVGDIEKLTGAIPLGVVPYDAGASKQPLVTADQFGGRAEAFRTLRTNLQFADVDDPPRVITITSALPAEGKTTTACNIALTLAQSGARVVLVEGDLRKPSVGKYLGISNAAGLTNVLAGQHDLRDVLVGYDRDTLTVLPSGPTPPNPSELLGSQQMQQLLSNLAEHYDVVIIDAPPLLPVTDAAVLAAEADGAIIVVRHGKSRREEVERALQALNSVNSKVLGSVLNFAPRKKRGGGYDGYGYGYGYGQAPSTQPKGGDQGGGSDRRGSRRRRPAPEPEPMPTGGLTLPSLMPMEAPESGPSVGWAPSPTNGWAPIAASPALPTPSSGQSANRAMSTSSALPTSSAASGTGALSAGTHAGVRNGAAAPQPWQSAPRTATPAPGAATLGPGAASLSPGAASLSPGAASGAARSDSAPRSRSAGQGLRGNSSPATQPTPIISTSVGTAAPVMSAGQNDSSGAGDRARPDRSPALLVDLSAPDVDLLGAERELLIPPQGLGDHQATGVPRHHRSKRSL